MNTNYTPGPYWLGPLTQGGPEEHDLHINIVSNSNILIANVYARLDTNPEISPAEAISNAMLFRIAPDLLSIVQRLIAWESDPDRYSGDLADLAQDAHNAFAKVKGARP